MEDDMQMLFLIALGIVSGTALIAGAIRLALYPPGIFKKAIMAEPLDRPDHALGDAAMYAGSEGSHGSGESHG